MSAYALYRMFINEEITNVVTYPHFWFTTSLFVLYVGTFFFWALLPVLSKDQAAINLAQCIQIYINIAAYLGIGFTMLLYTKMQKL